MSRPRSHDLPSYQREGHLLALIPPEHITKYPTVGRHLMEAIAEADHLGLTRGPDGSIRIPRSPEELDRDLKAAVEQWDRMADLYSSAMAGELAHDTPSTRAAIDSWAKREGRTPIDWTKVEA